MQLTPDNVNALVRDCLFSDDDDTSSAVVVDGIMNKWGFDPQKLQEHREDIRSLLDELPEEFHAGWSFLQACVDRRGEQWTGLHRVMDELLSLGQAVGMVTCLLPRDCWSALPGGMPYYQVKTT